MENKYSIILPKRRNYMIIFFLPIWLYAYVQANIHSDLTGLIVVNVMFLMPALFFVYSVLYNLFGKEIISISGEEFTIILKLFFYEKIKNYKFDQIDKFEFHDQERINIFKRSILNYYGIGKGNIRFKFNEEYKYFGIRLYDFEAIPIVEKLNQEIN
jgi:hypothetical protein